MRPRSPHLFIAFAVPLILAISAGCSDAPDQQGTLVGSFTSPDGGKYEGQLRNGIPNGKGTAKWPNGTKYVGQFKDGMFHGKGRLALADGTTYVGDFKDGKKNGSGTLSSPDGQKIAGLFRDGVPDGAGVLTWPDGRKLSAQFHDGDLRGKGVMTYPNGETVTGQLRNGEFIPITRETPSDPEIEFPSLGEQGRQLGLAVVASKHPVTPDEVTWAMLPGGDINSMDSSARFYVTIHILNRVPRLLDIAGMNAYFLNERGDVLKLTLIRRASLQKDERASFTLDTNGYTEKLIGRLSSREATKLDLVLQILDEDKELKPILVSIPDVRQIYKQGRLQLRCQWTSSVPDVDKMKAVTKDDWLADPSGSPALMRVMGNEKTIYFYFMNEP